MLRAKFIYYEENSVYFIDVASLAFMLQSWGF